MADIVHKIGITAPLTKVYEAIATVPGLAGWWTKNTGGESRVGGKLEFRFMTPEGTLKGNFVMDVVTSEANKRVQWKVIEGPQDWIGTEMTFDFSEAGGKSIVLFGHRNWRESNEHMAHCSMKWATFMLSLREFVETGKGKPAPDDIKIDNWN